jgi:hypothetical protein
MPFSRNMLRSNIYLGAVKEVHGELMHCPAFGILILVAWGTSESYEVF